MKFVFCWLQLFLLLSGAAYAVDVEDFSEINGYTVIDITYVDGDFEGADYDRPVILENGMIFRYSEYGYSYAYHPSVVVFARHHSQEDLERAGIRNPPPRGFTTYKLLINDDFYDANRVR
jgi:opacity protein-like surface antigen